MPARKRKPGRRPPRIALVRRWLAVGVIGLVAFLYYRPLTTYLEARGKAEHATEEIRVLEAEHARLERLLSAQSGTEALVRAAREAGYVKPGERLFIVKGIPEWRRANENRGDG